MSGFFTTLVPAQLVVGGNQPAQLIKHEIMGADLKGASR